ncbi:MAG: MmcQ/YjbR family DNA-binding protein [Tabrizicola sp.]|uniref:MmcQ/YjbR family DNA-binding protein n=1 Tax=Tabrizicola sp. TaxID=2005166 RepID=UPI002AB999A8|nr:MmcQ/YjbR family DNA-binding protein [Tabrizicola sp.]MDZ4087638.1 MmcQ/YjbR family DNA-binding protein [Tabrizicola sp.]
MTADTLARLALGLPGTVEVQHFDRRAFKARTIFASLAPDGQTANLRLDRDGQDHWCSLLPDALSPVPNKWGAQGWTVLRLDNLSEADLAILLHLAWSLSSPPRKIGS